MSDRDDDLCYWDGEPINAMTREALQKALGDAVMIIERKNRLIFDLNQARRKRGL